MDTTLDFLVAEAYKARSFSYSPYSEYRVGASLLCSDGTVYTGCNIENASYSATVCAERVAIFKAISDGKRDFKALCVVGGKGEKGDFAPPCGVCLQVISEFCSPYFTILLVSGGKTKSYTLADFLPNAFSASDIK